MARRGYKSNEDAAEFFKKMQEVADGKRTATSGNTQQQQLASKEALTAKPVVTPAVPTYQAPAVQPMGVQSIIGQANLPAAMAATGAAAGARMAAQPAANAILRPGDPAWKRNLALGGMDNLSQEQLLMAREQANIDARNGRNPYDNLPQAPDTGKTVWWNAKTGQGTGKTTASYVIGRADKAIERGDYKAAMQAIEYGINAEMSANDRQKLTEYIKAESFGGAAMRERETAGTAQQVADAWQTIGKTNTANWESWKAQNLNDDVMRYLAEDYGIKSYKDADDLAKKLTQQIRNDDDRRAWQKQLTGMREGYMTQNASAAFAQRGREEVARAQQDGAAAKTVQRYMQAQQAVTVLDWLADKLAINKPGRPADVDSQEVQLAVRALRAMGVNVPELNDQNYYDVVSGLREQEQTAVSQNWDVLEQRGYNVDLMAAYTARTTSKAFEQGLRALPKREMGVVDKVLASIASIPFSVYVDPFVGVANAFQVAGDGDVEDTGNYVPTVDTYDQPGRELRGQVAEGIGSKGWQFGYNALMSTADSVVGAATMGEGYTVAMGLSSMGAEIQNAIDHGVSGRRALVYGAAKGAIEILTEYVSTEKLVDMLRSAEAKTLIGRLGEIATQGATEGSEEMASDILGGVADAAILRGTSDHNQQVRELMSKGYSAAEAEAEVMADEAETMMESGLAGALSGMMGAGFAEGVNAAKGTKLAAEQIAALSQSEKAEDRLLYREICELAGVEYSMSDNKKMETLEAYLKEQRDNAKAAERQRKATERAVEETADEMIRNAAPEVPGLAMNELTMDTVEEDTETILQAAANAQTSQEAASAVKLAQDELAWISNAAALGKIERSVADELAENLERMVQSQKQMLGMGLYEAQMEQEYGVDPEAMQEAAQTRRMPQTEPEGLTQQMPAEANQNNTEEENYGRTESLENGSERTAGVDPDQQTGRMGESAGRIAEESRSEPRGRRAAEIRNAAEAAGAETKSAWQIGVRNGTNATVQVVPDSVIENDRELKAIRDDAEAHGAKLVLTIGALELKHNGQTVRADGLIQTDDDGNTTIYVQADKLSRSARQIYGHEVFHQAVQRDPSLLADIYNNLLEDEDYDDERVRTEAWRYAQAYGWVYGKPTANMSEEQLNDLAMQYLEEYFADAYGDLQRKGVNLEPGRRAVDRSRESVETVRGMAQKNTTEGGVRYSTEFENAPVNRDLLELIEKVRAGDYKDSETVALGIIDQNTAERIQEITAIDVDGWTCEIEARQINHILRRHGQAGEADKSMANDMDIAKIEYSLKNYESITDGGRSNAYINFVTNKNRPAKTVRYKTNIGGRYYYTVQAVPNTKRKTLYIVSAFIANEKQKETQQSVGAKGSSEDGTKGFRETAKTATAGISKSSITRAETESQERFEKNTKQKFSTVEMDEEYQQAVDAGDTEAAQRMVDQAARKAMPDTKIVDAAGNPMVVYHGTMNDFFEFDTNKRGGRNGVQEGYGIYTTSDKETAGAYGRRIVPLYANITHPATTDRKTITLATLKKLIKQTVTREADRMMKEDGYDTVTEAQRDTWISNYTDTYGMSVERAIGIVAAEIRNESDNDMEIIQEVMAGLGIRGYKEANEFYEMDMTPTTGIDGFMTEWNNQGKTAKIVMALRSEQLKMADAETYDDDGRLIPLSERFNSNKGDIRFSPDEEQTDGDWYRQRQDEYRNAVLNDDFSGRVDAERQKGENARTAREEKIKQAKQRDKTQLRAAIARAEADLRAIAAARRSGQRDNAESVIEAGRQEELKMLRHRESALQETLDINRQELARRNEIDTATRKERARLRAMENAPKLTQGQLQRKIELTEGKLRSMETAIDELEGQEKAQGTLREAKRKLQEELAAYKEAKRRNAAADREAAEAEKRKNRRKDLAERARSNLVTDALNLFSIPVGLRTDVAAAISTAADIMIRDGRIDDSNMDTLMMVLIENGEEIVQAQDDLRAIREEFRGTRVYVSPSVREEFGDDWKEFRQRAWRAGVYLTNNEADGGIDRAQMDFFGRERETSSREALENVIDLVERGRSEKLTTREMMQRNARQYGVSVDDQIAELRQKLERQLDRFAAAAEIEIDLKTKTEAERMETDQKLAEKLKQKRAEREERAARATVFSEVQRLERLARRADPAAQKAAREVIGNIDTFARRITPAGLEDLQELSLAYHEAMEADPDFKPDPWIEARLARLQKYQIDDMPIEDVRQLAQDVLAITHAIETRNKMLGQMKYQERDKMADAVNEEINKTKGMSSGMLNKWLKLEHIRPKTFFGMISGYRETGATASIAQALEDGQTKQMRYVMEAQKLFDGFTASKVNREWLKSASGKNAVWEDVMGVRMTPMMKISLYLHSLNLQNSYHVTEGGVRIPNEQEYRKGRIAEAYARGRTVQINPAQLKRMDSLLTDQEMQFAQLLKKYYDEFSAKRINETSMILYGYERATTKNYYHIKVWNKSVANTDSFLATAQDGTLEGIGSVSKSREQRSSKPIMLEDANTATLSHIDQMSKYTGMAIPLRDMAAVMTFAPNPKMELDETASSAQWADAYRRARMFTTVSETLTQKWGSAAGDYLDRLTNDLQLPTHDNDLLGGMMSRLRGKLAGATLGFNPAVALSQTASYPGAVQTLGVGALANGMKLWHRVDTKLIEKYSPLLWYRTGGGTEELQNISKEQGLEKKLPWIFGWIESMDKATVKRIWAACEWRVQHDTNFRPGSQADIEAGNDVYYQEVAKLFNRCVYDTQPNYSTFQRTQISRTKSDLVKFLTMYKTVPLQYYNMMFEAAGRLGATKQRYKESQSTASLRELKQARRFAVRTFGGIAAANVTYVVMKALVKGWLLGKVPEDEDGEMTAGAIAKSLSMDLIDTYAGSVIGLSEIIGYAEQFIGLKEKSFSPGDSNVVLDTAGRAIDELAKIRDAKDITELLGTIKTAALNGAAFLGIPAKNMEKYLLGLTRRIWPEAGAYYDNIFKEMDREQLKGKNGEEFRAGLEVLMNNRTDGVTKEVLDEIQRLWAAGHDAIPTGIPGDFEDANRDEVKLVWGTRTDYREAWSEAVSEGLNRIMMSDGYMDADDEQKAKMIRKLYDYGTAKAKETVGGNELESWMQDAEYEADSGVGLGEYIAYLTAVSETKKKDNFGTDGFEASVETVMNYRAGNVNPETVGEIKRLKEKGFDGMLPQEAVEKVSWGEEDEKQTHELTKQETGMWNQKRAEIVSANLDELVSGAMYRNADDKKRAKMIKKLYEYASQKATQAIVPEHKADPWTRNMETAMQKGLTIDQAVAAATENNKEVATIMGMTDAKAATRYEAAMVYAGKNQKKVLEAGMEFGVNPELYARGLFEANTDGKDGISKEEADEWLASLGSRVSVQEKAYLWQMLIPDKTPKGNNFGKPAAYEFYNYAHRNDE